MDVMVKTRAYGTTKVWAVCAVLDDDERWRGAWISGGKVILAQTAIPYDFRYPAIMAAAAALEMES